MKEVDAVATRIWQVCFSSLADVICHLCEWIKLLCCVPQLVETFVTRKLVTLNLGTYMGTVECVWWLLKTTIWSLLILDNLRPSKCMENAFAWYCSREVEWIFFLTPVTKISHEQLTMATQAYYLFERKLVIGVVSSGDGSGDLMPSLWDSISCAIDCTVA